MSDKQPDPKHCLLILSRRPEDIEFCQNVAKMSGFSCEIIENDQALQTAFKQPDRNYFVFWDVDSEEFSVKELSLSVHKILPILGAKINSRYVFGLASQSIFQLPPLSQLSQVGHYIVRNYNSFGIEWTSKLCRALYSLNPFGLENYKDEEVRPQSIELKASNERWRAVEAVGRVLKRRNIDERAMQMALRTVDEVLMNAIFSAPKDWSGRHYRKEVARDSEFAFTEVEKVTLQMAFNKNYVSFSVLDRFGSLSVNRAWHAVRKDYQNDAYEVNQKTKGAQLGLQGIAGSGVAFMISCRPNIETEVIVAFPYFKTYKEAKNGFRSFSFNIRDIALNLDKLQE